MVYGFVVGKICLRGDVGNVFRFDYLLLYFVFYSQLDMLKYITIATNSI